MLIRFIIGTVVGSFINVMVIRGQRNEDFVWSRSKCPYCDHVLEWHDMIPLFSYLFLKGKCRYCGKRISTRYLFTEIIGGILGILSKNPFDFLIFMDLFAIALYDHDTMEIKDSYIIFLFCIAFLSFDKTHINEHMIGAFIISVPMLIIALLFKGFGGGDIKLMAVCGFWLGTERIALSFLISCLSASIYSLIKIAGKKQTTKDRIPFAPFLSFGIITGYLYGFRLIDFYETLF
ncbi:MAG: prepilin peptidase [Erysipelotrichaceae bacterium]|nr:prepilin peptidase [Erysipelotrichaceae bacterium]